MNIFFLKKSKKQNEIDSIKFAMQSEMEKKNGKLNSAFRLIKKSINLDKKNDSFYYLTACILFEKSEYNKALQEINKAININPKIYYYYLQRADIYNKLNNQKAESDDIKYSLELMPKSKKFYEYKKNIYEAQSNKQMVDFCENRLVNWDKLLI